MRQKGYLVLAVAVMIAVYAPAASAAGLAGFGASVEAIPEPATVAVFGGVLVTAFSTLRRKCRRT